MLMVIAVLYGLHLVFLIYLVSFLAVRGITSKSKGGLSFILVTAKYFIYWGVISFGFKYLPMWGILGGLIGGVYVSLPVLYFVNKKKCFGSNFE